MSNPGTTQDAARSDERAQGRRTIVTALVAPVVVFFALAWSSSSSVAERRELRDWTFDGRTQALGAGDVEFELRAKPVRLAHVLATDELGSTNFVFELDNPSAAPVHVTVFVSDEPPGPRAASFRPVALAVLEPGATKRSVRATIENDRELANARRVMLGLRGLALPSRVVLHSAAIEHAGFRTRVAAMTDALLRVEPLSPRTNNFMAGPSLAGHGFGAVCWLSWAVIVVVLVVRRLAGARFAIGTHVALGTIVLFLAIDARNWVDGWGRLRSAQERHAAAKNVVEELAPLEPSPWFIPALERLRAATTPTSFAVERVPTEKRDLIGEAEDLRLAYYGHPARAAANPADAQLVIVVGSATSEIERDPRFHVTATFADGSRILERAP
ncbi:MAG: hypothetical protein K8S98_15710 [Planctomycetes bacterium]|nr:hypothetical protein [Planctomycetota bacterium]